MKHSAPRGFFVSCLLALLVWLITLVILLPLFCLIVSSTADPDAVLVPLSLCALYLSALACGIGAVRLTDDGVLSGAVSGLFLFLLLLLLSSLPLPPTSFDLARGTLYLALVIPVSVVGSVIGRKRAKKPKSLRARKSR